MSAPYCWRCIDRPDAGRRSPNRAAFLMWLITGEASFECEMHARLSARVGGEGFALRDLPTLASVALLERDLAVSDVRRGLLAAAFLRQPDVSQYQLEGALRDVLPDVLVTMLRVGLDASLGGPEPPIARKAEAPVLEHRRLPNASPGRKKRG